MQTGQCSCAKVQYQISSHTLNAYRCHCQVCQKASGSAYSTTVLVKQSELRWLKGEDQIKSYVKPSGYRLDFCQHCASPVPNLFRGQALYCVPAGSLNEQSQVQIKVDLFLASQCPWAKQSAPHQHQKMPELTQIFAELEGNSHNKKDPK